MTFNPYAPPGAEGGGGAPGGVVAGEPQPWNGSEAIGLAWERFKLDWPTLVFAPMVGQMIAGMPGQLPQVLLRPDSGAEPTTIAVFTGVCTIIGMVIGSYFAVGTTRIFLSAARGKQANFGDIFSGGDRFGQVLLAQFLMSLVILLGILLFIVPGIIASLGLMYTQYYVIDRRMSAVDAMKASWAATDGHKVGLFGFGFLCTGVALLGLLACCIGILPATSVIGVATAIIYTRLSGTMGDDYRPFDGFSPPPGGAGPGMGGPGWGAPPGGWGAPPDGGYAGPPAGPGAPPAGGSYGPPTGGGGGWGG